MHTSGHTGLQVRQNHPEIPSRDSPEGSPKCHPSLSSCPAGLVAPHFPLALLRWSCFLSTLNYFLFNPRAQLPRGWGCCSALLALGVGIGGSFHSRNLCSHWATWIPNQIQCSRMDGKPLGQLATLPGHFLGRLSLVFYF